MAVTKTKRSYYLPTRLIHVFDQACEKGGYVRERVVAAAIQHFLTASPNDRAEMFKQLDSAMSSKRGG